MKYLAFNQGEWLTLDTSSYQTNRLAHGVTHWCGLPQLTKEK